MSPHQSDNFEVTVVVPTHNRRELLATTLRSVLAQRQVRMDVVVVDDGSSDGTSQWVEGLGHPLVRLVSKPVAGGVARARNAGIALARGKWLAFVDDDDLWAPDKLRLQIDAANAADACFVYCGSICFETTSDLCVVPDRPVPPPENLYDQLLEANVLPGGASAQVVRATHLRRTGGFDPDLHLLADWDLWLRIVETGRAIGVERPLVAYRQHSGNMVASQASSHLREFALFQAKHRAAGRAVKLDPAGFAHWIAGGQRRAGNRMSAARIHAAASIHHRDLHHLGCAVRAPFGERLMGLRAPAPKRQPSPSWLRSL